MSCIRYCYWEKCHGSFLNSSTLRLWRATSWMQYLWGLRTQPAFWWQHCFPLVWCVYVTFITHQQPTHTVCLTRYTLVLLFHLHASAFKMASILQKLITPLCSGPPEPPRNKVTVVGVGQVGMACAISVLLRVRAPLVLPLLRLARPAGIAGWGNTRDPLGLTLDYWSPGVWSGCYPLRRCGDGWTVKKKKCLT